MSRRRFKPKKKDFFEKFDYSVFSEEKPTCPHFGDCGGCSFQNISYPNQVKLKEFYLKDLFKQDVVVLPAKNSLGYRNRMDFVYNKGVLGLRRKGDFKTVVDISTCFLIPEKFRPLFLELKKELSSRNIDSYDIDSQEGFLRYVVMRLAPNTNQAMLIFTSSTPINDAQRKSLEDLMIYFSKKVKSVQWFINDSLTDVSIPDSSPIKTFGEDIIVEKIGETSLSFGPLSFFQANSAMSEIVFNDIKEFVFGETVDLCCGVGAIGLFVANKAKSVCGIEQVKEAIDLAKINANLNNAKNALFFVDNMKNLLDYTPLNVDTLILDPPRAGLGNKVVKKVLSLDPQRIIYMSCNPKTQKIDLSQLTTAGNYEIKFMKAYDMFPNTPHVESLVIFERQVFGDTSEK